MSNESLSAEGMCPNCESMETGTYTNDRQFEYGVEKPVKLVAKNVLFWRCMSCSQEWTDNDQAAKNDAAVITYLTGRVTALEADNARLRQEVKDTVKEMHEAIRDAAAEATWAEREAHNNGY